jgi:hypothetical protein
LILRERVHFQKLKEEKRQETIHQELATRKKKLELQQEDQKNRQAAVANPAISAITKKVLDNT